MSNFYKDISFRYGYSNLLSGEYFSCEKQSGNTELRCFHSGNMASSHNNYVWNIALTIEEKQALCAALWAVMDQEPIAEETAIVMDGSPTHLTIEYKGNKIEHDWNSWSDHDFINYMDKLIGKLSSKPHTKRMLRPLPDEVE